MYLVIGFAMKCDGQIVVDSVILVKHYPLACHPIGGTLDCDGIYDQMVRKVLRKRFVNVLSPTDFGCFVPYAVEVATAFLASKKVKQISYEEPWAGEVLLVETGQRRVVELLRGASAIGRSKTFEDLDWVS